jgi:hypothetical protein
MESLNDDEMQQQQQGKGKLLRDSNVTVIQVFPSERANRKIDKVVSRRMDAMEPVAAATSDLEVLTLTPYTRDATKTTDGNFMKLHIINVRTGKIQDAIMLTTSGNHHDDYALKPKAFHRTQTPSKSSGERFCRMIKKILLHLLLSFMQRFHRV